MEAVTVKNIRVYFENIGDSFPGFYRVRYTGHIILYAIVPVRDSKWFFWWSSHNKKIVNIKKDILREQGLDDKEYVVCGWNVGKISIEEVTVLNRTGGGSYYKVILGENVPQRKRRVIKKRAWK